MTRTALALALAATFGSPACRRAGTAAGRARGARLPGRDDQGRDAPRWRVLIPNDATTFGVDAGAPAVAAVLKANGLPGDAIPVSINSLLVRTGGHVVVIDTGLGPKTGSQLIASLAAAGVAPGDVTDVLITHTHGDHVGGLVDVAGALAFPNAKIRMGGRGMDVHAEPAECRRPRARDHPADRDLHPRHRSRPRHHRGRDPRPHPRPCRLFHHLGRHRLLDIGDTAHSTVISLAKPDWIMGFDGDKATGKASRRKLLTDLAKSHETVFAPHFPYPAVGTVAAKGDGFVWVPAAAATFTN